MRKDTSQQFDWSPSMETLEDRVMMSADPVGGFLGGAVVPHTIVEEVQPPLEQHLQSLPDFWIDPNTRAALEEEISTIDQSLAVAHDQTGLSAVRANYGFTGAGQTVAVIDSGIAYDQLALGGGFGANYRVVGGWDFTGENDGDPYDDGPSGGHGTHVAGIIGSDSETNPGVAPDVDLVALRVFDDAGAGYFNWVENALQWVYDNRDSFENPITTVNLSLGVATWNSEAIPAWANLEEEFAQLEEAGIFIAVSAGNSYANFGTTGLSYPASSQYVIPVMSVDDTGLLSSFSQRSLRGIAAPGRTIISTVPDYAGDNNGINDDFRSKSGTSMAAPYVAGASVIIREAMDFVGYTNITQDMIYDHMIATADTIFDASTGLSFSSLNMEAAIDALIPADDFGSTIGTAFNLGTVNNPVAISGQIGTLTDVDYFTFTAANTGTVTFAATNTTYNLSSTWEVTGGTGWASGTDNEIYTVDVTAGQQYTVGISSSNGLGGYDLGITSESTFTFTDWGSVAFSSVNNVSTSGETWYRIVASSSGYLTTDVSFNGVGGQISLELYNADLQQIDSGTAVNDTSRVDTYATAGEEFYVRVLGTNSDVDFRMTNLVSIDGTTVNIAGTAADDAFVFTAGNTHQVSVNGVTYDFASIAVTDINFSGGAGSDSITLTGTAGDETVNLRSASVEFTGSGITVLASSVEEKTVNSGGGAGDIAYFFDTFGDETYNAYADRAVMEGTGFRSEAVGFAKTWAYASLGTDTAVLHDGATDDRLVAGRNYALMVSVSGEFFNYVTGFDSVSALATAGGQDYATFHGSAGDEQFIGSQNQSEILYDGGTLSNVATGFDAVFAYGNGGTDTASLYDAGTDDLLIATESWTVLQDTAGSFSNYAAGFSRVDAYASAGGNDVAYLYDGAGDDRFVAGYNYGLIVALDGSFYNYTTGFDSVFAIASGGGEDYATLHDSAANDIYAAHPTYAVMTDASQTYYNHASGFEANFAYSTNGGNDEAKLYGGATNDNFIATPEYAELHDTAGSFASYASGFGNVSAYGGGGNNEANLYDGATDDRFVAGPQWGLLLSTTGEFYNYASGFQQVTGYATGGGEDFATFYDSIGDDRFTSGFDSSVMEDIAATYRITGHGFDKVFAYASGGEDTAILRDSSVDDLLFGRDNYAYLSGGGRLQYALGFDTVRGESTEGGSDTVDAESIEYVFEQIGDWA